MVLDGRGLYGRWEGAGVALCFQPTVYLVPQWFLARRGLATGIAVSGSGVGTAVVAQVLQASIDVESMIRTDLAKVLALEIDRVGIYGTGSTNQPLGLTNTTGVGTQTITGAGGTYAQIVAMETTVGAANADANAMKYILNAAAVGSLKTTEKSASGTVGNFAIMDTTLNGYEFIKSNQLGTNDALFGDFSQMILGMWSGLDLKVDDITGATAGTVRVIALQDLDFAVKQPSAFVFGT